MKRLSLVPLVFLSGCFSLERVPPSGYEVDDLDCADGRDNDFDGRTDCQDTDCVMRGHCGEQIPDGEPVRPETSFFLCQDGIDNDDDGTFDCGDRDCSAILELCCLSEFDDETCSDGRDNDGNGFADCGDFSCRNNPYVSVCETESVCDDGIDNDGDRFTDCADTECVCTEVCNPGCRGPEDTLARCQDGFDNDANNFVDCNDFSCTMSDDPAVVALCNAGGPEENTLALCMNGMDDDGNSYIDCADRNCSLAENGASPDAVAYCASMAENTVERCTDGIDNDNNGFLDCSDFSCSRAEDPAVVTACQRLTETSLETCRDSRDNDSNGFRDCADNGCQFVLVSQTGLCSDTEPCPLSQSCYDGVCLELTSPCSEGAFFDENSNFQGMPALDIESTLTEQIAMSVAQCTDGLDNDEDGFVDCEDWECNYNPRVVNAAGEPICRTGGTKTCLVGPNAGLPCVSDATCGGRPGSCSDLGFAGQPFVCP